MSRRSKVRADVADDIADYYRTERPELAAFLRPHGPFEAVLDIGCAAGMLGKSLLDDGIVGACDGIELNAEAARLAGTRLRRVWNGSLEFLAEDIPWPRYDLVILADVLEHLVDPWAALRLLHARSAPGCRLLLSVPNVRHYKVSMPLLFRGEFRYTDSGIMDRTHLHFFTRNSLEEAVRTCGWTVSALGSHMKGRYRRWYMPTRLIEPFVAVQHFVMADKA